MSRRNSRPVPHLDLAPKLKRSLSLLNPLDYLRLVYWIFFFPQALRWYLQKFGKGYEKPNQISLKKGWDFLRQHPVERQLLLQSLALTAAIPLTLGAIFQGLGFSPNWFNISYAALMCLVLSVVFGISWVMETVIRATVYGVLLSLSFPFINTFMVSVPLWKLTFDLLFAVWMFVIGFSIFIKNHILWLTKAGVKDNLFTAVVFGLILILFFGAMSSLAGGISGGLRGTSLTLFGMTWEAKPGLVGIGLGVADFVVAFVKIPFYWCVGWSLITLRPESYLLGLPFTLVKPHKRYWWFHHVTLIPLPSLSSQLKNWLQQDWKVGIYNANQLLNYTLQFTTVVSAVNQVLARTPPELVLSRVADLAEAPYDWKLVRFASASLKEATKSMPVDEISLPLLPYFKKTETRLDTPARAAAAGFWYLHEGEPRQAAKAFLKVAELPYGWEMCLLALTLSHFENRVTGRTDEPPRIPEPPHLRPKTWQTITRLHRVNKDIQLVEQSVSRSARSLAFNRALGELTNVLEEVDTLPQAEKRSIYDIAHTWRKNLLETHRDIGEIAITEPVINPHVVGDPVQGELFIGREDIVSRLEELWVVGHQLQSVVLYGHRRMGKTSILKNTANCLGSEVKVAYVNLLNLGNISQGIGEMLMAISDEIARTVNIPAPDDEGLLNLPYRTFERYLKQVEVNLEGTGLIIALDEFEQIEKLIVDRKIEPDCMGFLRGLVQMSSKIAFIFAGLHTLEEMTEDYFHPFFSSIIPIPVRFLTPDSTYQVLANPRQDFLLDYTPETVKQIYALTAGQPYLIQLIGFQLVRRYNNQVFEQQHSREPVFTIEDLQSVINSELFTKGRYYFTGVWGQAKEGEPGQQAILKAIAPYPEGLNIQALTQATGMKENNLHKALQTLKRHDVIEETEGNWRIIVELFRRWVLDL